VIDPRDRELLTQLASRYGLDDAAVVRAWADRATVIDQGQGEVVQEAGHAISAFFIVAEGLVRYFYRDDAGRERNKAFFREGQFIGSLSAYLTGEPSPFTIETLERSRLYRIPLSFVAELEATYPVAVERVIGAVARELFVRNEQREALLLTGDGKRRYAHLVASEPWLLKRVPQYHLASYLGMDPVTFSRLKSRLRPP
jgi:CRP-like cAMP-binding protein